MSKSSSKDAVKAKFNGTIHENFEETDVQDSSELSSKKGDLSHNQIQVTINSLTDNDSCVNYNNQSKSKKLKNQDTFNAYDDFIDQELQVAGDSQ
jgi:hypothetical protein